MQRIRTIKPEFFVDEDVSDLSFASRLLFVGLWTLADKEGRLEDRPKRIKVQILPYDQVNVEKLLSELSSHREAYIIRYSADGGRKYIQIRTFTEHQRPNSRESASVIPEPTEEDLARACTSMHEHARAGIRGTGREREGNGKGREGIAPKSPDKPAPSHSEKKKSKPRFKPPTIEEVQAYIDEMGFTFSARKFVNHYTASDWMRGKTKIRDWKACCRTWHGNEHPSGHSVGAPDPPAVAFTPIGKLPKQDAAELSGRWFALSEIIREHVEPEDFESFVDPFAVAGKAPGGGLVIGCSNKVIVEWAVDHILSDLPESVVAVVTKAAGDSGGVVP